MLIDTYNLFDVALKEQNYGCSANGAGHNHWQPVY